MTPGEKEIMRIYADGIYCSLNMIEKSGGFWITSSSMKPGESCSRQTALQPPIAAASDSDSEIEERLRDSPEPSTPPVQSPPPPPQGPTLTPGAARITGEAVVDVVVEEQLPWLEEDVSSSETSNPRTPSPDIELGDLYESEGAAPKNLSSELHDEVYRIRDPETVHTIHT